MTRRRKLTTGALSAGATAAAVSSVIAVAAVEVTVSADLLAYVYGVGGSGDKDGANIPAKLSGEMIHPGDSYEPIGYSAGIPVDPSIEEAIPLLRTALRGLPDGEDGVVVGYSEGAVVAEHTRRNLQNDPDAPDPDHLRFVLIAGPTVPNGGIYARFPVGIIPGFISTGPSVPTDYDTTYVTVEYDTVADFPAYFNPLSIANSLVAFVSTHPDPSYNAADIDPLPALTTEVENSEGATDTYVFIPAEHLPILWPVRQVADAVGATPITEPVLGLVEPTMRVMVDMGDTDRDNANPEEYVPFSFITPPEKVEEAVAALPAAIDEGRENFQDGVDQRRDPRPGIRLLQQLRGDDDDEPSSEHAPSHEPSGSAIEDEDNDAEDSAEPQNADAESAPADESPAAAP